MRDATLAAVVLALAPVAAACTDHTSFEDFRSAAGRFHAQFPGVPVETVKKTVTFPTVTEVHVFLVERGGRGSSQVSYYDLLPLATSTPQLAHDAMKLDCLSPFDGSSFHHTGERSLTLGTAAGIAETGKAPSAEGLPDGGIVEHRCFIAGGRMYHAMAIGPDTDDSRADIAHFLDSFGLD